MTLGAAEVRELLERHGLAARRSLGQNFVTDPGTVRRIVALAGIVPGSPVLEVGPGVGSLTLALVEAGAEVTAVEKDPSMLAVLEEVLGRVPPPRRPRVLCADAVGLDWGRVVDAREWSLVANLPYNVAVPILLGVLDGAPTVRHLWVMVQAEVAERLCAPPGGRTIGVPTIKVGWYASARIAMSVSPEVFTPRPRVRSAVVELHRRPPPSVEVGRAEVFGLVDRAYGQRRKMLRATLGDRVPPAAFAAAGVDPRARPEQLSVADWAALASAARH